MSKSADSYAVSRTNAQKCGIAVAGPMRCRGLERCVHGEDCPLRQKDLPLPATGDYCLIEHIYALQLFDTLRRTWRPIAPHLECELDVFVQDAVEAILQRERVSYRQAAAWDLVEQEDWDALLSEQALCDRYYAAALNRWSSILERVNAAWEKLCHERWVDQQFSLGLMQNTDNGAVPMRDYPGSDWARA